ncbi:MAG: hypothetical protein ACI9EF_002810 [Pseudohongiellaceae bacterium]|jgi:hypothetical protein
MLRPFLLILMVLACGVCPACLGPSGRTMTAAEYALSEQEAAESRRAAALHVDRGAVDEHERLAERSSDLRRATFEFSFEQTELVHRRERMALQQAADEAALELVAAQARERLVTHKAALLFFTDVERAMLLGLDALEVQEAEDGLLQVREELAQLELMYGADPAEATAEIVVARTRRRIVRREEQLRLLAIGSRLLKEVELPKRLHDGQLALQSAAAAVAAAESAQALAAVDRATAERALDHEEALLQWRLEDQERRDQRLEEDQRQWERDELGGATSGSGL